MHPETFTALVKSIFKWERIVAGTGTDDGVFNCALCQRFHERHCRRCPVAKKSGKPFCRNTPYDNWQAIMLTSNYPLSRAALMAAEQMLAYLVDLVPIDRRQDAEAELVVLRNRFKK